MYLDGIFDLLDLYQNWYKKRKEKKLLAKLPKEGIDYEMYLFEETNLSGIRLLKGKYQGIIYFYRGVKFSDLDSPRLSFEYEIYQTGNITHSELINDEKFVKLMGDILTELLVNNETTRTYNTKEFDLL